MKNIFLIAILSMVLVNCSSDDNESFVAQTVEPILIGKGLHAGNANQQNSVVTNQNDWNELLNMFTEQVYAEFTEIDIDFNNFQLLVSVDEPKPDSGYSLTITDVTENENDIAVTVISENTGSGYTVITQPFHIVKIPKSDKPVVFE